jgi:phage-related tail protein
MSTSRTAGHGLLHSTVDVFLDRTRAVAELVASAGGSALERAPDPVPAAVTRMLASMRQLTELVPPLTGELDVLVEEVHAKRKSVQALQAELGALDRQLEVLERTLAPVEAWSRQWTRIRTTLAEPLEQAVAETAPAPDKI